MMCRGLVLDDDANIVVKSLDKFFSIDQGARIPDEDFVVQDKLDGSMLCITKYQGHLLIHTRGSFVSEQIDMAKEILLDKYVDFDPVEGYTYVFEIVHHKDRKIVKYTENDLYLITVVNTSTLEEEEQVANNSLFPRPKIFSELSDIKNLPYSEDATESEGYVIEFDSGYRIKAKSPSYILAHRVYYGATPKRIWEMLRDGKDVYGLVEGLPDEFQEEVNQQVDSLLSEYLSIHSRAANIWFLINGELEDVPTHDRKTWAMRIKEEDLKYHSVLFALLSGKPYENVIWNMIKPENEM
jgi:RNA ligase